MLTISTTPLAPSAPDPRIAAARDARLAYEEALVTDGVNASTWRAIARQMQITAAGMVAAGMLQGFVDCHLARALDAAQKADLADRMVVVAREYGRVIDLGTLVGGAS